MEVELRVNVIRPRHAACPRVCPHGLRLLEVLVLLRLLRVHLVLLRRQAGVHGAVGLLSVGNRPRVGVPPTAQVLLLPLLPLLVLELLLLQLLQLQLLLLGVPCRTTVVAVGGVCPWGPCLRGGDHRRGVPSHVLHLRLPLPLPLPLLLLLRLRLLLLLLLLQLLLLRLLLRLLLLLLRASQAILLLAVHPGPGRGR